MSEFPAVVIPLHTLHYPMLRRNLFYTAVIRGKRLVTLIGTKKALGMAVRRVDTGRRHTGLGRRLQAGAASLHDAVSGSEGNPVIRTSAASPSEGDT